MKRLYLSSYHLLYITKKEIAKNINSEGGGTSKSTFAEHSSHPKCIGKLQRMHVEVVYTILRKVGFPKSANDHMINIVLNVCLVCIIYTVKFLLVLPGGMMIWCPPPPPPPWRQPRGGGGGGAAKSACFVWYFGSCGSWAIMIYMYI